MNHITLLHVEDDPDDAFFFDRALAKAQPWWKVQRVTSGEEALHYLEHTTTGADRQRYPMPELVVLDLKLPGMNGFEVLSWVRSQELFLRLPVVILSGSSLEADRRKAEALGASGYLVKSSNYGEVIAAAARLLSGGTPFPSTDSLPSR